MARFERQQGSDQDLPRALETAADELRSSLERQVREIVEAAEERAAEIEQEASHKAGQVERHSHQILQESLQAEMGRAWAILGGINDLESRVADVVGALRAEIEALISNLESLLRTE